MSLQWWTALTAAVLGVSTLGTGACGDGERRLGPASRSGALPVAWEAGRSDGQVTLVTQGKRPSVYRIDADGALVRRDARSGKVLWRRPAPGGVRWTGFQVGRAHVACNGAPRDPSAPGAKGAIAAVAVADGRLLWTRDHRSPARLGIGIGGGGLFLDGGDLDATGGGRPDADPKALRPCEVVALHPDKGTEVSRRFRASRFVRSSTGGTSRFACQRTARGIDWRQGMALFANHQHRPGGALRASPLRLSAWPSAQRDVWMKPIGVGPLWRVAMAPRVGIVSASIHRTLVLLRLHPSTGRVTWHKSVQSNKSCPWAVIRVRAVPGPGGKLALLAQRCDKVLLYDAETGKVHWEHKTDVITAVVGERPHGWPPPSVRVTPEFRKSWFKSVEWRTPAGKLAGSSALPPDASDLYLVPEGLLVGVRRPKGLVVGLIDHQGKLRWSGGPTWNVWLVHPFVVVGEAVRRIATGASVGTAPPGKVIGLVPEPHVLITEQGGRLRALRLP